jgi:hypothetical protein
MGVEASTYFFSLSWEPEYVLLDKYICNKEVARIEAR